MLLRLFLFHVRLLLKALFVHIVFCSLMPKDNTCRERVKDAVLECNLLTDCPV